MFLRKIETDHLMNVVEAKKLIESVLKPRIRVYEDRLKKPWYERGVEYLRSNSYGEAGYKRTKKFLNDMQKISQTKDLIRLTTDETYQKGTNLPFLLQKTIVQICGFNQSHINLIIKDLRDKIARDHNRYVALRLCNLYEQAISRIYENIIESKENYGSEYLFQLNTRLSNNSYSIELSKMN